MNSILDALQEGRLFELPEGDKARSLQFLAHIIEAFPETPAGTDVVDLITKREEATNTAIGRGIACPHARVPYEEDLMCVIGWSPKGIDYGAPDGKPVALVVMYVVPDNQRNHYLREISMLAKALVTYPERDRLSRAVSLEDVRNYVLDLIDATKASVGPDSRATMIRLQTKAAVEATPLRDLSSLVMESVTLVAVPGMNPIALAQNPSLVKLLDSASGLIEKFETEGAYQDGGWRLLRRGSVAYQGGRVVYDCLAIRVGMPAPAS